MNRKNLQLLLCAIMQNKIFRYVFWGGCTTLVNFLTYFLLRKLFSISVNPANIVSVMIAIVFAYFVNARFVFSSGANTTAKVLLEFAKFVTARLFSMAVEIGGVWLLVDIFHSNDMWAKVLTQFIVLVANYIISKFIVFC